MTTVPFNVNNITDLNTDPVVTTPNGTSFTVSHNSPVAASTFFTASDADTDSIVQYDFWDNGSAGGTWLLNGIAMLLGRDNFISASLLSQVTYRGGAGTETIWERASDGIQFGAWTSVNATDTAPVVTTPNANVTLSHNTPVAATTLFTASDADGDGITQYDFWDTGSAGGHWLLNGVALPNNQENLVPASQLSQVTYQAGGGTETIYERASDGIQFGAWKSVNTTDTAPTTTAIHTTVSGASNLTFAPSNLFTVSETDGDSIVQYDLWSTGGGGGDWLLNGLPLSINKDNFVTAAQLSQVVYRAGSSTDTIWMRASDGAQFGAWSQALTVTYMPVVTPASSSVRSTNGQTFAASSLFSAQDGDGDTITQYDLVSTATGGGQWLLDGVLPLPDNQDNFVNSLAGVIYKAGPGQDTLSVRASDGTRFGEFSSWTVNSLPIALFTTGSDTVNFNALTADQAAEVAAGANIYHGLGGSDIVTFPDIANYNTLGWMAGIPFVAGDTAAQSYTITGGNGPDTVQLGAGTDTVYGSPGNDAIRGGTGQDTFDYQGGKYANFSGPSGAWPAMTQTITGGHSSFQTNAPNIIKQNIIKLPGSASDYQFNISFNFGDTFSGTQTSISSVNGAPAYVINATGVEKADFAHPINNKVALADNNIAVEMLQLAAEVYGPQTYSVFKREPLAWEDPSGTNTGAKVAIAAQSRGWHPVSALELGMAPADFGQFGTLEYSFVGGQYQGIDTSQAKSPSNLPEANALVLTGLVHDPVSGTDKRTLAIVIRGTDQVADATLDYADFKTHYAKFAPLVQAIQNYLADPSNGIQQVLISGHSLGAGVVPYFLQALQDTSTYSVQAYVDGPPGSEADAGDSRIENFVHAGVLYGPTPPNDHAGDPVPILGEASHGDYSNVGTDGIKSVKQLIDQRDIMPKSRMGSDVLIDDDVFEPTPNILSGPGPQHNDNLYAADLAKLVRFANDDSSPFAWTDGTKTQHSDIALALRAGSVYQGSPVATAVGQPTPAELKALTSTATNFVDPSVYANQPYAPDINVYWRDDYVLSEAGGIIHWDQPWTTDNGQLQFNANEHLHVVDGGSATTPSVVELQGSSSSYSFVTNMTALGPETDLKWIDSSKSAHLIGQLYRVNIKKLEFLPDGASSPQQQFVEHLDGSAVSVQTASAGQTALMVDPSFDYTDAGNGNLTVIGSGTGDFIALGSGNATVFEPGGDNTIFVKDAASAGNDIVVCGPGEDTVSLGDGTNQIIGTTGILTVDFSGDRSQYQIIRLASGALQITDERSSALNGTDIVTNGSFYQFADQTCTLSPPSITTADVTAAHGQSFAVSDLFAAADADSDVLAEYQLVDATTGTGAHFLVNGAAQSPMQLIDLSAAQLALTTFQSGSGTDQLFVRASNGIDWSAWASFNVIAPLDNPPTVTAPNVSAGHGQTLAASALATAADPDGDAVTQYQFYDFGAGGGHLVLNDIPIATGQLVTLTAAQFAQTTYAAGVATDALVVRASDGFLWSSFQVFTVTDTPPTVTVQSQTNTVAGQTFALSSLVTAADGDGNSIAQYQFYDVGAGGAQFRINGTLQSSGTLLTLTVAQFGQAVYMAGNAVDTLMVRASDGVQFSPFKVLTVSDPDTIAPSATLELTSAYSDKVTFLGSTGTLQLDNSTSFSGTVAGLIGQDTIDFTDIDPVKVQQPSYSGTSTSGTLTVSDGTHTANIALLGNYMASIFVAGSDGHGGTSVLDAPNGTVQPLVTAPHA
jgi:hypothetical protein